MSNYLIKGETLTSIADAIRAKTGSTEAIAVGDMASSIEGIESGGFPNGTEWNEIAISDMNSLGYAAQILYYSQHGGWLGHPRSNSNSIYICYSDDGYEWHEATFNDSGVTYQAVYVDHLKIWVAVRSTGIYYSFDRVSWTSASSDTSNSYDGLYVFNRRIFAFATANNGHNSYYSDDGVTWATIDNFTYLQSIIQRDGRLIGFNEQNVWYTDDGVTWSSSKFYGGYTECLACAYKDGRYIMLDANNGIRYSDDCVTSKLSQATNAANNGSVFNVGGTWVVVLTHQSAAGTSYHSIDNGLSWTKSEISVDQINYYSTKINDTVFVNTTTGVSYSEDGVNWTSIDAFSGMHLKNVLYGAGIYIATVGFDSTYEVYYSIDKQEWRMNLTGTVSNGEWPYLYRLNNTWYLTRGTKNADKLLYSYTWKLTE